MGKKKNKSQAGRGYSRRQSYEDIEDIIIPDIPKTPKYRLFIESNAFKKLREYVKQCPDEIQGFGQLSLDGNKIKVHNVFIIPQEVSSSSAEIEEEDLATLLHYCLEQDPPIGLETIKFWWHSHVSMDAFWSGTDTQMIDTFKNGWMVSLVTNKHGECKVRLDIYEPFRVIQELDFPLIFWAEDKELEEAVKKEINDKVKRTFLAPAGNFPSRWYEDDGHDYYNRSWRNRQQCGSEPGSHGGGHSFQDRRRQGREDDSVGRRRGGGAQSPDSNVRGGSYFEEKSRRSFGYH